MPSHREQNSDGGFHLSELWSGSLSNAWWALPESDDTVEAAPLRSPLGSLVPRRSIYTRNGIAWISMRAWSSKARQADVAAMRVAKQTLDASVIDAAADEIGHFIGKVFGQMEGWAVSTVAVGHSRRPDSFAVRLAEGVAAKVGLPFVKIFKDRFVSGTSHPKEFAKLPPLDMLTEVTQPLILIDDVATSGWHLEEALNCIRQRGVPAVAIAWISGTVK